MRRSLLILAAAFALASCGTTQFSPAAEVPPVVITQAAAPEEPPVGAPVAVAIPKLGVIDDVIPVGLAQDNAMEVPPVDKVGYYRYAPLPGQQGPAVLAGHVDWDGVDGAFKRLGELTSGDKVTVTDDRGVVRTFAVYDVRAVLKKDFQARTVPLVFGARTTTDLVMVTCGGRLDGREYLSNVIASARLVISP